MAKLHRTCDRYQSEIGVGAQEAVTGATGALMKDLVLELPPKDPKKLEARVKRGVGKNFYPKPKSVALEDGRKLERRAGRKSKRNEGIVWLEVGPRFLLGCFPNHYKPQASLGDMLALRSKSRDMGEKYTTLGQRGKQKIMSVNRYVVGRQVYGRFKKEVAARVGRLKMSFATAWNIVSPKGRIPAWLRKNASKWTAKGRYRDGLSSRTNPWFEIISNADGCEHGKVVEMVRRLLRIRIEKMEKRLGHLIRTRRKSTEEA